MFKTQEGQEIYYTPACRDRFLNDQEGEARGIHFSLTNPYRYQWSCDPHNVKKEYAPVGVAHEVKTL